MGVGRSRPPLDSAAASSNLVLPWGTNTASWIHSALLFVWTGPALRTTGLPLFDMSYPKTCSFKLVQQLFHMSNSMRKRS